ncbi:MAG: hypothetical protein IPK81_11165 [Rhodospirillales bacterium]|nr:MAG: hypothetical protein IPK81_11165 [Rhodospirillales bacterium]
MISFLTDLEAHAQAAARREADYRMEARDRLDALEAQRVAAYRRLNLMRGLSAAMGEIEEAAAAVERGVAHVCGETSWTDADEGVAEVRQRLLPVAEATLAADRAPAGTPPTQAPTLALSAFEAWYRARFGVEFTSLMARDAPSFTPVVDF